MKLGISSLSHIISVGTQSKEINLNEFLLEATRSALEFSEYIGLDVCELVIDPMTTFNFVNKSRFISLCKEFKIQKQVHAALIDVCLCSNNSEISKATFNTYMNNIDIANKINATTITIHPGSSSIPIPALKHNNYKNLVFQLKNLLKYSKNSITKICLENMDPKAGLCRNIDELNKIYQDVSNSSLFFTYDTSHLWMNSLDYKTFIHGLGLKIGNVHLADNLDKKIDQHPTIGKGNVPFPSILDVLQSENYRGSLIIELLDRHGLEESIDNIRKLL